MSKYGKIQGLTERVIELRGEGMKWDVDGGIVDTINAEFGTELKSAIPLRKLFHSAQSDGKATPAKVRDARLRGEGWGQIAARHSITEGEAKRIFAKANAGDLSTEGRVYVRRNGVRNLHAGAGKADRAERVAVALIDRKGNSID